MKSHMGPKYTLQFPQLLRAPTSPLSGYSGPLTSKESLCLSRWQHNMLGNVQLLELADMGLELCLLPS